MNQTMCVQVLGQLLRMKIALCLGLGFGLGLVSGYAINEISLIAYLQCTHLEWLCLLLKKINFIN